MVAIAPALPRRAETRPFPQKAAGNEAEEACSMGTLTTARD